MGELCDAYKKHLPSLGEEMADVSIYLMGVSRILGVDLEKEMLAKIQKNHLRDCRIINGVNTRIREGNMPREDQTDESRHGEHCPHITDDFAENGQIIRSFAENAIDRLG